MNDIYEILLDINFYIIFTIILLFPILLLISWCLYKELYYRSKKFKNLKNSIENYISNCNELNKYIDELSNTYIEINRLDYGSSIYIDNSRYNYKRPKLKNKIYAPYIYNCSRTVCDNARKQPFKYICKYFNIKSDEETLDKFETVLNNFETVEQGKVLLKAEKLDILNSIEDKIPFLIKKINNQEFEENLGFEEINFNDTYFPRYIFQYISPGGNSSLYCEIIMNIDNLNKFITYLSENIKFKKSIKKQRILMTSTLRKQILDRDKYTCQYCGLSSQEEPNLLLEIDHIIPISKGGITITDNLQTLCWRCNRKKGSKIIL